MLFISFIICLLCFVGCKNQQDVVNPNVPDGSNQEQTGNELPNEDETPDAGNENLDEEQSGEDAPNVEIPDEGEELPEDYICPLCKERE